MFCSSLCLCGLLGPSPRRVRKIPEVMHCVLRADLSSWGFTRETPKAGIKHILAQRPMSTRPTNLQLLHHKAQSKCGFYAGRAPTAYEMLKYRALGHILGLRKPIFLLEVILSNALHLLACSRRAQRLGLALQGSWCRKPENPQSRMKGFRIEVCKCAQGSCTWTWAVIAVRAHQLPQMMPRYMSPVVYVAGHQHVCTDVMSLRSYQYTHHQTVINTLVHMPPWRGAKDRDVTAGHAGSFLKLRNLQKLQGFNNKSSIRPS